MAARTKKIRHDDETRAKIQTSQIINRFHDHILGKIELSATQVRCGEVLLKKTIPDLSSAENKSEVIHRYVAEVPLVADSTEQWQQQHNPTIQ